MKLNKALPLLSLVAALTGCASYSPENPIFQATRGKEIYGQVNSFFTSIDSACRNKQNSGSPYCADKENYVWTGVLVGQHTYGIVQKGGLAVPKAVAIQKGDIIEYHLADDHPWAIFDRVAARSDAESPTSACRWDGSHTFSGGVVCNGWRWNKDYPALAD